MRIEAGYWIEAESMPAARLATGLRDDVRARPLTGHHSLTVRTGPANGVDLRLAKRELPTSVQFKVVRADYHVHLGLAVATSRRQQRM